MARSRGNRKDDLPGEPEGSAEPAEDKDAGRRPAIPELARRAISLGLSGFFLTEETIRKALGDTVPKDWTDFAAEQSERTRKEFLERLSFEIAQSLEKVDLATILRELLEGRTLEVRAEIRLGEGRAPGSQKLSAGIKEDDDSR